MNRVHIKDFRIIEDADIEFGPKLNIIIGEAGGGKTTVIEYLIKNANLEFEKRFEKLNREQQLSRTQQIEIQIQQAINPSCLLMDNLLSELNQKNRLKILKELENCGGQVIVTLHWENLKEIKDKINAKIINLDHFKIKWKNT